MKKTKKKGTLKLRRRIRKTVASLFMIMAVVVASIPVENLGTMQAANATLGAELGAKYSSSIGSPISIDSKENEYDGAEVTVKKIENSQEKNVCTIKLKGTSEAMISAYDPYAGAKVSITPMICEYTYEKDDGNGGITKEKIYVQSTQSLPTTYTNATKTGEYTITAIGHRAFDVSTAQSISEITIPNTVEFIGAEAFRAQSGLTKITIPKAVTKIDRGAFCDTGLTSLVFETNTVKIEVCDFAFYNCQQLSGISFSARPFELGEGCFAYGDEKDQIMTSFKFPDEIYTFDETKNDYILAGRTSLISVSMPAKIGKNDVTKIPDNTLSGCTALQEIKFTADSQKAYFDNALLDGVGNASVIVEGPSCSDDVTSYEKGKTNPRASTINGKIAATNYDVPYKRINENLIEIGIKDDNGDLLYIESMEVGSNNKATLTGYVKVGNPGSDVSITVYGTVGKYSLEKIADGCFTTIKDYLGEIIIADDAAIEIGDDVFNGFTKLKTAIIGDSVKSIGARAFKECTALEEVELGDAVATIGKQAFSGCVALPEISIGDAIAKIDNLAFEGCTKLEDVYFSQDVNKEWSVDASYWSDLKIAADSFKTGSDRLTFHGAIHSEYAPYVIASNKSNTRENELTGTGYEIRYKSDTWDNKDDDLDNISNSFVVIKNRETQLMTLIEYPEASIVVEIPNGVESLDAKSYFSFNEKNLNTYNAYGYTANDGDSQLFENDIKVEEIILSSTIEEIGKLPFVGCTKLYNIDTANNDKYDFDNMIFYQTATANGVSGLEIVQCLQSRGEEGDYGSNKIDASTNPKLENVVSILEYAFSDCDKIRVADLRKTKITEIPIGCFYGCDNLADVELPESAKKIDEKAFCALDADLTSAGTIYIHIPNPMTDIEKTAFDGNTYIYVECVEDSFCYDDLVSIQASLKADTGKNVIIMTPETIAQSYTVKFIDEHTGKPIDTFSIPSGDSVLSAPEYPTYTGEKFLYWEWYDKENETYIRGKEAYQNIEQDREVYARYEKDTTSSGSSGSDGSSDTDSSNGSSGSNNSGGTTGSNGSSGTTDSTQKYTVTVNYGSGSGDYEAGATVSITAYAPESSTKTFSRWTTTNTGIGFTDATKSTTTFTMPSSAVVITANYKTYIAEDEEDEEESASSTSNRRPVGSSSSTTTTVTTTPSSTTTTTGTSTNTTQNVVNGNSGDDKLYINKNGVSNKDVGTASVDGSTDNFVVKIADAENYLEQIKQALINKYGSLDGIMYFPMDINLYDATGSNKVTDTYGLDIDVTMPIPDVLIQYGGNAKVAAVENSYLQELTPKFKTIDGIACMSFTPPHFSPYVIYVDTNNLVAGLTYDATPATGDTLHPKWFVVIGMASFSVFLFVTGDKKRKVRLA